MIKKFLQRLGLLRPTDTDEHIEFMGDNVSLQRKNYPQVTMTATEEYALYSDLTWEETVCFMRDSHEDLIYREDTTIQNAIQLLQDGYVAMPF